MHRRALWTAILRLSVFTVLLVIFASCGGPTETTAEASEPLILDAFASFTPDHERVCAEESYDAPTAKRILQVLQDPAFDDVDDATIAEYIGCALPVEISRRRTRLKGYWRYLADPISGGYARDGKQVYCLCDPPGIEITRIEPDVFHAVTQEQYEKCINFVEFAGAMGVGAAAILILVPLPPAAVAALGGAAAAAKIEAFAVLAAGEGGGYFFKELAMRACEKPQPSYYRPCPGCPGGGLCPIEHCPCPPPSCKPGEPCICPPECPCPGPGCGEGAPICKDGEQ